MLSYMIGGVMLYCCVINGMISCCFALQRKVLDGEMNVTACAFLASGFTRLVK